ncbi:hypothetical protein D3C73_1130650 [compost metagenome]
MIGHHRVLDQVGADVDDAANAGAAHAGQRGLRGVQRAAHAAFDLLVQVVPGQGVGVGARVSVELKGGQRVVDHRGYRHAEVALRLRDHPGHGGCVAHVGLYRQRAVGRGGGQCLRGISAVQIIDHHARALAQEGPRDVRAQTTGAARDNNQLFVQGRGAMGNGHGWLFGSPARLQTGAASGRT